MKLDCVFQVMDNTKIELKDYNVEPPKNIEDWYFVIGKDFLAEWLKYKGIEMVDESEIETLLRKYYPEAFETDK